MKTDRKQFLALMVRLRACYPHPIDREQWVAMVARYFDDLAHYRPEDLALAFQKAPEFHVRGFPSLGELLAIVKPIRQRSDALGAERQISQGEVTDEDFAENQERIRELIANLDRRVKTA